MKLEEVIEKLQEAKEQDLHGFIEVTIPNQIGTEYIVNQSQSIDNKIEYYKNTYDENGVHKSCSLIQIVDAGSFSYLKTK